MQALRRPSGQGWFGDFQKMFRTGNISHANDRSLHIQKCQCFHANVFVTLFCWTIGETPATLEVVVAASPQNKHRQGFLLLTLLTCSVVICWGPTIIFHIVVNYFHITHPVAERVTGIFFTLEPICDPILFAFAITELGDAILKTMKTLGFFSPSCCRARVHRAWIHCAPMYIRFRANDVTEDSQKGYLYNWTGQMLHEIIVSY